MIFKWEDLDNRTDRAKVIGGWVLRSREDDSGNLTVALVFINDSHHEWTIDPS